MNVVLSHFLSLLKKQKHTLIKMIYLLPTFFYVLHSLKAEDGGWKAVSSQTSGFHIQKRLKSNKKDLNCMLCKKMAESPKSEPV